MDLWGSMFDFDMDGHTDMEEELLGLMMMDECFREEDSEEAGEEYPE